MTVNNQEPFMAVCPPAPPGYQPNGGSLDEPANKKARHETASSILQEIAQRRAAAGKLGAGVAAATDSDMYKGPVRKAVELGCFTCILHKHDD